MKKTNMKEKTVMPKTIEKTEKTEKAKISKNASGFLLFGIRNKIVICFLIPIIFMVFVGICAYRKAEEGLSEKFQESTLQTIETTKEYIEMCCSFIKAEGLKYAFDGDVSKYLMGTLEDSLVEKKNVVNEINNVDKQERSRSSQ